LHALLADLAHVAQAPDLEAAAVGEDGAASSLEAVQAAELRSTSSPGRIHRWKVLPRMICAPISSRSARHHALDGAVGAHGHEDRRLDDAVVEREPAAAGVAFGLSRRSNCSMRGIVAARMRASFRARSARCFMRFGALVTKPITS
jgi:hypothetical protein